MLHNLKRSAAGNSDSKQKVKKFTAGKMSETLMQPVKSYSDKKEYRLVRLPNGMTSLLVQHFLEDDHQSDDNQKLGKKASEPEDPVTSSQEETDESGSEEGEGDEEEDTEKEKMAAVALCIGVGSFYDPTHIQGLSHFLEHMIFMGSEKYPKENEFDQFVSSNGGADNAMTECEHTLFYFEIVEEHLAGAIDRFAQLFVSPLMLRDSMEREVS